MLSLQFIECLKPLVCTYSATIGNHLALAEVPLVQEDVVMPGSLHQLVSTHQWLEASILIFQHL